MHRKSSALILYGATEAGSPGFSSDLLWRTRFVAPDPILLIEIKGKTYLFASSLEFGRARNTAQVDHVLLLEKYIERTQPKSLSSAITLFLKEHSVRAAEVPGTFPYALGNALAKKLNVNVRKEPLYPERLIKTAWEIKEIQRAQHATEAAFLAARNFLAKAKIRNGKLYGGDRAITSELVQQMIDDRLYRAGYLAQSTIVAGGKQAVDPHNVGNGPLPARQPIIIDIFPRSLTTHYFGDFTRTVFKGMPSNELQKMYEAVRMAQVAAIGKLKEGMDGAEVHKTAADLFVKVGYPTRETKLGAEGFIHSTGHGVGIDIHEGPSLGRSKGPLRANMTVTIEPGLYYPRTSGHIPAGGIRIEDLLVVTRTGSRNLTHTPKDLTWAILK